MSEDIRIYMENQLVKVMEKIEQLEKKPCMKISRILTHDEIDGISMFPYHNKRIKTLEKEISELKEHMISKEYVEKLFNQLLIVRK